VLPAYTMVAIRRDDPQLSTFMPDAEVAPHRTARRWAERWMLFAGGFKLAGWFLTHG